MTERLACTYCGMEGHRANKCPRRPRERDIERHLVRYVTAMGGEVRKVQWVGRRGAPDRLVMMPDPGPGRGVFNNAVWVELKAPGVMPEGYQLREHRRMREMGQRVVVIDSIEGVDGLFA